VLALVEETGYHDPSQWVLYAMIGAAAIIALGAASIATALANADGRDDLVTLGAVGASPRTRRVMSMSRAGVIAGLGCAVGVVAGFVPAYAWARGDRVALAGNGGAQVSLRFVVPWSPILLALFGIPAVAALLAGAVTRSRLPSERHAE
jgi:putative ABC transport system permease protein